MSQDKKAMSQDKKMSQDIPVPELPSSSDGLKKKTLMPGLQLSFPHFISLLLRYYVAVIGMMEKL